MSDLLPYQQRASKFNEPAGQARLIPSDDVDPEIESVPHVWEVGEDLPTDPIEAYFDGIQTALAESLYNAFLGFDWYQDDGVPRFEVSVFDSIAISVPISALRSRVESTMEALGDDWYDPDILRNTAAELRSLADSIERCAKAGDAANR